MMQAPPAPAVIAEVQASPPPPVHQLVISCDLAVAARRGLGVNGVNIGAVLFDADGRAFPHAIRHVGRSNIWSPAAFMDAAHAWLGLISRDLEPEAQRRDHGLGRGDRRRNFRRRCAWASAPFTPRRLNWAYLCRHRRGHVRKHDAGRHRRGHSRPFLEKRPPD